MLAEDLTQRKYIVTGDLTPSLFADDCSFVDPNNAVRGLARYRKALSFLFEPAASRLGEVDVRVVDATTIQASHVASGVRVRGALPLRSTLHLPLRSTPALLLARYPGKLRGQRRAQAAVAACHRPLGRQP